MTLIFNDTVTLYRIKFRNGIDCPDHLRKIQPDNLEVPAQGFIAGPVVFLYQGHGLLTRKHTPAYLWINRRLHT